MDILILLLVILHCYLFIFAYCGNPFSEFINEVGIGYSTTQQSVKEVFSEATVNLHSHLYYPCINDIDLVFRWL